MSVTAALLREREIYGVIEGAAGLMPRDVMNADFRKLLDFKEIPVAADSNYLAFPYTPGVIGGKVPFIYSSGPSHGNSDRQKMAVFDPATETIGTIIDFVVSAAPTVFNCTLLDPLMSTGDKIVLKSWTVEKTGSGTFTVTAVPTVVTGGITYAAWSKVTIVGATAYRMFYSTSEGTKQRAALFSSSATDMITWTKVSDVFHAASTFYNECDFVVRAGGQWVAFVRDATAGSLVGLMAMSTSDDAGATWASPTAMTAKIVNGVQPHMFKTSNDDIFLMVGDRSGSSGYTAGGSTLASAINITGIAAWRLPAAASTAAEANWGYRTQIARIYSTDGGQPYCAEISANRVVSIYYSRRRSGRHPGIYAAVWNTSSI